VKQKEKIRRELYQLLETAVQSDVEITPTKAELESGTELIEMSEDSPKPDADFLTTPIENSPAAVTIAEVEAVKPAVNSEEPMEATESNISSQTENEAQSLPKPESLSVPLPSKRSSANWLGYTLIFQYLVINPMTFTVVNLQSQIKQQT